MICRQPLLRLITIFVVTASSNLSLAAELTKNEYLKQRETMAVILVDINWGRAWGCGKYENAQLELLRFDKVPLNVSTENKYNKVVIKTPSRLFVKPEFLSYGFIVEPGKYAFSGWSVKVALSVGDVRYFKADHEILIKDDKYPGGIIEVTAGEIVYAGNFYIDCYESPIPWRYYTEGKANFSSHVKQYVNKFKFIKNEEIKYRLLNTEIYGIKYTLPD